MESLNGRWISQTAMAPAKGGEESLKGVSETLFFELVQARKICCTSSAATRSNAHTPS